MKVFNEVFVKSGRPFKDRNYHDLSDEIYSHIGFRESLLRFAFDYEEYKNYVKEKHFIASARAHQERLFQPSLSEPKILFFNQADIIKDLDPKNSKYMTLNKLNKKYNGLCEIVSNFVIANDMLGQAHKNVRNHHMNRMQPAPANVFQMNINLSNINQEHIRRSHIMHTSNIFVKLMAIFFEVYPHNIISSSNSHKLFIKDKNKNSVSINKKIVLPALSNLSEGEYVKFFVFKRKGLSLQGHSMVIKKTGFNRYSFFDPNFGEYRNLSKDELYNQLDKAVISYQGNRVAFIDGAKYIKDIGLDKKQAIGLKK